MGPKLLLVNPAMVAGRVGGLSVNGRRLPNAGGVATMEPLALALVAASTPVHWEVRIVDEVREDIPDDDGWRRPDLVALTSLSITAPRAYTIARDYRERGVPVVMGGVHATLLPDEAAHYVDVVFQGDVEGKWPALIRDFEAGQLKPRYNGGAAPLLNVPTPRRDVNHNRYLIQLVSASRGCCYRCEFCTLWKLEGGGYRARPPEEVLDELNQTRGKRPILFTDENVFVNRDWALDLFRGMAERGLRRPFAVQASLNVADDDEVLAALRRSGCMAILVGFESVSEESLRGMRKGVNLRIGVARYKEKIARLHAHGLAAAGTFMFGNDGDGPDIFERTVGFVQEAELDLVHFGLLTPNPGTDLYDRLAREGRLLYVDFPADHARYDLRTAVFQPLKMTPEQLEAGLLWATEAVGSHGAVARRAWHTWRSTGNPLMTLLALFWNRSGFYRRIVQ
jgi:radical SAM superfamily enzyme YgiQ (UPF0313 family)